MIKTHAGPLNLHGFFFSLLARIRAEQTHGRRDRKRMWKQQIALRNVLGDPWPTMSMVGDPL